MLLPLTSNYLIFIIILFFIKDAKPDPLRVCIAESPREKFLVQQLCDQIYNLSNKSVVCDIVPDRLTCLRRILHQQSDFTQLQIEDLVIASKLINYNNLVITNEIKEIAKDKFEYDVIAVIRKKVADTFNRTRKLDSKTFCHPGYGFGDEWDNIVSREFEYRIVPQKCNVVDSLLENFLNSSALFFKEACKAGEWVNDKILDSELKEKYKSLCSLCDYPDECSNKDRYWGNVGPLSCLTSGEGDLLWARLDDVKLHFNPKEHTYEEESGVTDFVLLCPDGLTQPLFNIFNSSLPCIWISRPWPVVVSLRKSAESVRNLISERFDKGDLQDTMKLLVAPDGDHIIKLPNEVQIADKLLDAGSWVNAATRIPCYGSGPPRVCVSTPEESKKCQWLSEAAFAYGVIGYPICVFKSNCLNAVLNFDADIAIIPPNQVNILNNDKFQCILYESSTPNKMYNIVASYLNPFIKTFEDLKGKNACFPEYSDLNWISALSYMKNRNLTRGCDLFEYFSNICVVSTDQPTNIPLCYKNYKSNSSLENELQSLMGLYDGKCDVTFTSNRTIDLRYTDPSSRNFKNAQLLHFCAECSIGSWPLGLLIGRKNEKSANIRQWITTFLEFNKLFGPVNTKETSSLQLFGPFDGVSDILFHDSTEEFNTIRLPIYLTSMEKSKKEKIEQEFLDQMICHQPNASHLIQTEISLIVPLLLFFYSLCYI